MNLNRLFVAAVLLLGAVAAQAPMTQRVALPQRLRKSA